MRLLSQIFSSYLCNRGLRPKCKTIRSCPMNITSLDLTKFSLYMTYSAPSPPALPSKGPLISPFLFFQHDQLPHCIAFSPFSHLLCSYLQGPSNWDVCLPTQSPSPLPSAPLFALVVPCHYLWLIPLLEISQPFSRHLQSGHNSVTLGCFAPNSSRITSNKYKVWDKKGFITTFE